MPVSSVANPAPKLAVTPAKAEDPAVQNATADVIDVLKLRADAMGDLPYAAPVKLVAAVDRGLESDGTYDMAYAANEALKAIAPALNQTILGAVLGALIVGNGGKELRAGHGELREKAADLKEADKGERFDAFIGFAAAAAKLSTIYRATINAGLTVGNYVVKVTGATRIGAALTAIAASPVGKALKFANKWIPLVNATWTLMALRTAFQVFNEPRSSATSKTLAVLNVAASSAVLVAGVWGGCGTFFLTILGGLLVDLGLATARHVDTHTGDMDAHISAGLKDPVEGVAKIGRWLGRLGKALWDQRVAKVEQAKDRLDRKPNPRRVLVNS